MFRVNLEAGRIYQLAAEGSASHHGTLADPYLRIFDAAGHLLDYANGGGISVADFWQGACSCYAADVCWLHWAVADCQKEQVHHLRRLR
jgi:hypothetical protein